MSIFNSLFGKTASASQSKTLSSDREEHRSRKTSLRSHASLLDTVGRMEVND